MKKSLAIILSIALLAATMLGSFTMTASAAAKTDTWIQFDAKECQTYTATNETQGNWDGLTYMAGQTLFYTNPTKATIVKYVAPESGTLEINNVGGLQNVYNQWYSGSLEFAILDKNKKVIFPADGNPALLKTRDTLAIDLSTEVAAGEEIYFFNRYVQENPTGTQQTYFIYSVGIFLNGIDVNYNYSLAPVGQCIAKKETDSWSQGVDGWYYMYADTSTIEISHNDPNGATDFGGDRYVATYDAKPMIHNPEEGSYKNFWITDTENKCLVGGSIAYPAKGESIIARFTAPEDGTFHSDFFTVGLNYGFDAAWSTAGHGADFFIANQDGEIILPLHDGVAELRSPGSKTGTDARDIYNNIDVYHMKKGDYLDFVIVGLHDYSHGVSISGDFSFNGKAKGDGGWLFLKPTEQQGDRNIQMLYSTDVQVEKASTEAWLESVHLEKPLTAAPATVEAWVNIPAEVPDYRVGTIISDYEDGAADGFTVSVGKFGRPRIQYGNGTLDWTVENVDLRTGAWQHIAFTVDAANNTLSFYLDGVLEATATVTGVTAAASNRAAVIGNDLTDAPSTAFTGQMKKLALYSDVRTADEIAADMNNVSASADALLGYYPLNGVYTDKSASANHGTVTGFNNGFYDGELAPAEEGEYTIISMGDQQQITTCYPGELSSITRWIVNNREKLNIQAVVNVGDYVMNSTTDGVNSNEKEWGETTAATQLLTDANIPFFFTPGNHEYPRSNATTFDETHFKKYYPLASYYSQAEGKENASKVLYAYPSTDKLASVDNITADMSIANAAYYTKLGGQEYIFFSLEPDTRTLVTDWANVVMPKLEEAYPNAKTIVITHIYLSPDGNLLPGRSDRTFNNFVSKHKSICMVLCGHNATGIAMRTDYGEHGNKITSIMNDSSYEWNLTNGGEGVLQLFRFKKDGTVKVEYYSTMREEYYQSKYQFDLELESEEINQYWLDFDEKQMPLQTADKVMHYVTDSTSSRFAHTQYRTYVEEGGRPSIRTFVAPKDGTFRAEKIWTTSGITVMLGGSVKFAITNDDGKILWPADGKPATLEAPIIVDPADTTKNTYYPHDVQFSTPVKAGDKLHFVFYSADGSWAQVEDSLIVSIDSYADFNQFAPSGKLVNRIEETGKYTSKDPNFPQGPVWYYNYADSITQLTYNPNNPAEGYKSDVELTYTVKGEGGSLEFKHNGKDVEAGKVSMPRGGTVYAYAYADEGYRVKGIYANGVNVSKKDFYNLVSITEDIDFVVEFERIPVEGDANGDGVVDILDAVRMAKTDTYDKSVCDLHDPDNADVLDVNDLKALCRLILKKL